MNHPIVGLLNPRVTFYDIGAIPQFLDLDDPRPAAEQFNERYVYGGWHPQSGFYCTTRYRLQFPGDPELSPLAVMMLRDETIMIYDLAYVAIWQKDGTFEACRMD